MWGLCSRNPTIIIIHANAFVIDAPQQNFTMIDLSGCSTLKMLGLNNNHLLNLLWCCTFSKRVSAIGNKGALV